LEFKIVVVACIPVLVYQIKNGWVEKNLPSNHSFYKSVFWKSKIYLKLYEDLLDPINMKCNKTGMYATGVSEIGLVNYKLDIILKVSMISFKCYYLFLLSLSLILSIL
jgi:hypothetical protein